MDKNKILCFAIAVFLLGSCSRHSEEVVSEDKEQVGVLTAEQRSLAGIRTAAMDYRVVSSTISCTGEIEVPPNGIASVTAPMGGYIVNADIVPGRYVKKGELLARLSNPEYITLQQSFLETSGQLMFAEQDYARQKTLVEHDAAAMKRLQESESSYKVLKARLAGLKSRLEFIGINVSELEGGRIVQEISLRSPLSGYVTEVNYHKGQFVDPQEVIFRIVDLSELHLHLNVFEKDVAIVRRGQKIRFRRAGGSGETFSGEVMLVSPERDNQLRTFGVHGHIDNESDKLKPGMYVEAEILVSGDSVFAVNEGSVVTEGGNNYVLVEEGNQFQIVPVNSGVRMDGWVEIRNPDVLRGKQVVVEGANRLFAELKK
jgi:cobalt-zinc-cadmium efflux system membrane fusion protein